VRNVLTILFLLLASEAFGQSPDVARLLDQRLRSAFPGASVPLVECVQTSKGQTCETLVSHAIGRGKTVGINIMLDLDPAGKTVTMMAAMADPNAIDVAPSIKQSMIGWFLTSSLIVVGATAPATRVEERKSFILQTIKSGERSTLGVCSYTGSIQLMAVFSATCQP
jgi:hypothetical protein